MDPERREPVTPDLTLAFLDVIANGLGCLLVLFFLTIVMRTELAWPTAAGTTARPVQSDTDPFVLLVTPSTPAGGLPPAQGPDGPWRVEGAKSVRLERGRQVEWGDDYALLILNGRPPSSFRIMFYLPPRSRVVECQWFTASGGGRQTLTPNAADPWVQVWPRPDNGEK